MKSCFGKICTKNADKLYVHTVVLCTLLVLIAIAVIVALGLYFGITKSEYQSYNKVLNATALKTGNGTSLLLNGKFYSVLPKNNVSEVLILTKYVVLFFSRNKQTNVKKIPR